MTKRLGFALLGSWIFAAHATAAQPAGRYANIVQEMRDLQAKYPRFSSVYSIGDNEDGVSIYAMRISTTPTVTDPKKIGNIIVSTHHGNELQAPVFTLQFTRSLLLRYAGAELFRGNLGQTEWTIVPVLNVSGYNADSRFEHGLDPNRNYPAICTNEKGGSLKSIQLMMNLLAARPFTGSLTVHGYAGTLTYPWGVDAADTRTGDNQTFERLAAKAAAINGYQYGTSTEVVYPADGAYEDYAYWKYGTWSLLLELKDGSDQDIRQTSMAVASFFDSLDSSPSVSHRFTSLCNNALLDHGMAKAK